MVAHILFFMIIISLVFIDKKYYKFYLAVALFSLFVFSALRYGYGNDFFSYQKDFLKIHSGVKNVYGKQIAFEILNRISPSYIFLLCIISAFFLIVFYKMIIKSVKIKYLWISFFVLLINPYNFLMSLSALRQTLGLTMFIIATNFSYNRRLVSYVAIIGLATLFHTSAIILLPFYFIANESCPKKVFIILFIVFLSVFVISENVFGFALEKVLSFFDSNNYKSYAKGETNSLISTLMYVFILFFVLINLKNLSGKALMSAKLYAFSLAFGILAYRMTMLTRVQQYFDIFAAVAIPNIIMTNIEGVKQNGFSLRRLKMNSFGKIANIYIFPIMFFSIFLLKYYSFFNSSVWQSYRDYITIFSQL